LQQPYFIVVLAHSLHGRLRRIHVPHTLMYAVLGFALLGMVTFVGFVSSYARMAWKVSNYNNLRSDLDSLRNRYQKLQRESEEKNHQMATLQLFASEVSTRYGIGQRANAHSDLVAEGRLVPTLRESVDQYNYLKQISFTSSLRARPKVNPANLMPSLWPVNGSLVSHFGMRMDPFSGQGGFHPGVDLHAPVGTPIRAAADGRIVQAGWNAGYGISVMIDHENDMQTLYGHLSRVELRVGQEVKRGQIIGLTGTTGRSTGPHLHYEVHVGGAPVNPYRYLRQAHQQMAQKKAELPFGAF
jgi:murein DD-endopeptidase MepM/ murein hydrolase activator NlpD